MVQFLNVNTQASGFGSSGFRESSRTGAIVFAILPYRRLGPATIGFGQLLLKGTFHAIEHPDALLISSAILLVSRLGFIAFQMRYIKTMNGLRGLSSASIDALDFIPNVSIIVLLGKLGRSAVR
jgi:hypothetical protein